MVQFLSINFFLGFLQCMLGFSNVPVFLCHPVYVKQVMLNACYQEHLLLLVSSQHNLFDIYLLLCVQC